MLTMKVHGLILLFALFEVGFARPAIKAEDYEDRLNRTIECARKIYNEGKPEIGLLRHDPLVLENIVLNFDMFGLSSLQGNITFKNLTFHDFTKFNMKTIEATDVSDPESPSFHIVVEWPRYRFEGYYDLNVVLKEESATGKGRIEESFTNYHYDIRFKAAMPLTAEDFGVKFSFDDLKFHMDELLVNGKDIIADIQSNLKAKIEMVKQNAEVINKAFTDNVIKIVNVVYAAKMYNKPVVEEIANCWKSSQ